MLQLILRTSLSHNYDGHNNLRSLTDTNSGPTALDYNAATIYTVSCNRSATIDNQSAQSQSINHTCHLSQHYMTNTRHTAQWPIHNMGLLGNKAHVLSLKWVRSEAVPYCLQLLNGDHSSIIVAGLAELGSV